MRRICLLPAPHVEENTHALSRLLAGAFTPTALHATNGESLMAAGEALFRRAQEAGFIRPDLAWLDIGLLLEALAQIHVGDSKRDAEMRQRLLGVIIDGLRLFGTTPIMGTSMTESEQAARWIPKSGCRRCQKTQRW